MCVGVCVWVCAHVCVCVCVVGEGGGGVREQKQWEQERDA